MSSYRLLRIPLAVVFVAGCDSMAPKASISQVVVAPGSATISTGESIHLNATVTAVPASSRFAMQWTSSDIAATVDSNGVVLGMSSSPGVSICATASDAGSSMKSCATVIVSPSQPCPGPAASLIPSLDSMRVGDVVQFQIPSAQLAGRSTTQIRWALDNTAPARVDSLSGVVTALSSGGANLSATDGNSAAPCPHQWRAIVVVR